MTPEERNEAIRALLHGVSDHYVELTPSEKVRVYSTRRLLALQKLGNGDLSPHNWSDYPIIMREEIGNQVTILKRIYERQWDEFVSDPRTEGLQAAYNNLLLSQRGEPMWSNADRSVWLRRVAVQEVCKDLYQLGNLEEIAFGAVYLGFETPD